MPSGTRSAAAKGMRARYTMDGAGGETNERGAARVRVNVPAASLRSSLCTEAGLPTGSAATLEGKLAVGGVCVVAVSWGVVAVAGEVAAEPAVWSVRGRASAPAASVVAERITGVAVAGVAGVSGNSPGSRASPSVFDGTTTSRELVVTTCDTSCADSGCGSTAGSGLGRNSRRRVSSGPLRLAGSGFVSPRGGVSAEADGCAVSCRRGPVACVIGSENGVSVGAAWRSIARCDAACDGTLATGCGVTGSEAALDRSRCKARRSV